MKFITKSEELFEKYGIYLLALGVIILNISLAFDNVVWGDEAYSQMAIRNCSLYGIYERTYYWDSHPPLYYYYLRLFADLFGYKTVVYHFASLVPFVAGIVLGATVLKKQLGAIPAAFFIVISGLSESCVEYNLEIRMYSLLFCFTMLTAYCAYLIVKDGARKRLWVIMTLFGVLAAYTHYFGLAICGLIIFFTSILYFIEHKHKSWIRGAICTLIYIVLYIPWLFVLYFQTLAELGNSWMTSPETLSVILRFITGGQKLQYIVIPYLVILTITVTVLEIKKSKKALSPELKSVFLYYAVMIALLIFAYVVSYAFHPMLAFRYTYCMIPLVLLNIVFLTSRLLSLVKDIKINMSIHVVVCIVLTVIFVIALFDFKYFRSITKTQDFQTRRVLDTVGTPQESCVMVSNGVKHLAWSVLPYYYPDYELSMDDPNCLPADPPEIWAFIGYVFSDELLDTMNERGYTYDAYMDMWMGKYGINLYHFYR